MQRRRPRRPRRHRCGPPRRGVRRGRGAPPRGGDRRRGLPRWWSSQKCHRWRWPRRRTWPRRRGGRSPTLPFPSALPPPWRPASSTWLNTCVDRRRCHLGAPWLPSWTTRRTRLADLRRRLGVTAWPVGRRPPPPRIRWNCWCWASATTGWCYPSPRRARSSWRTRSTLLWAAVRAGKGWATRPFRPSTAPCRAAAGRPSRTAPTRRAGTRLCRLRWSLRVCGEALCGWRSCAMGGGSRGGATGRTARRFFLPEIQLPADLRREQLEGHTMDVAVGKCFTWS